MALKIELGRESLRACQRQDRRWKLKGFSNKDLEKGKDETKQISKDGLEITKQMLEDRKVAAPFQTASEKNGNKGDFSIYSTEKMMPNSS